MPRGSKSRKVSGKRGKRVTSKRGKRVSSKRGKRVSGKRGKRVSGKRGKRVMRGGNDFQLGDVVKPMIFDVIMITPYGKVTKIDGNNITVEVIVKNDDGTKTLTTKIVEKDYVVKLSNNDYLKSNPGEKGPIQSIALNYFINERKNLSQ